MAKKKEKQDIPGGFIFMPKWVFLTPDLGRIDREIYLTLAFFADNKTRTCYPTIPTIMRFCRIGNRQTVWNSIKRLEESGCVVVNRRKGCANIYYLPKRPTPKPLDIEQSEE